MVSSVKFVPTYDIFFLMKMHMKMSSAFENVVWKITAILFRTQSDKKYMHRILND